MQRTGLTRQSSYGASPTSNAATSSCRYRRLRWSRRRRGRQRLGYRVGWRDCVPSLVSQTQIETDDMTRLKGNVLGSRLLTESGRRSKEDGRNDSFCLKEVNVGEENGFGGGWRALFVTAISSQGAEPVLNAGKCGEWDVGWGMERGGNAGMWRFLWV